jgi:hypothetical protein
MTKTTLHHVDPELTAPEWQHVMHILVRYISPTLARAMMKKSVARCSPLPGEATQHRVQRVVEDVRVGIGLFCEAGRVPDLMLELAECCYQWDSAP